MDPLAFFFDDIEPELKKEEQAEVKAGDNNKINELKTSANGLEDSSKVPQALQQSSTVVEATTATTSVMPQQQQQQQQPLIVSSQIKKPLIPITVPRPVFTSAARPINIPSATNHPPPHIVAASSSAPRPIVVPSSQKPTNIKPPVIPSPQPSGDGVQGVVRKDDGSGRSWVDPTLNNHVNDYNLFIGNLSADVTDLDLQTIFSIYPSVTNIRIIRDPTTMECKGYGFIGFKDPFDMLKALREKNGKVCRNRPMQIKKSKVSATNKNEIEIAPINNHNNHAGIKKQKRM